MLHSGMPDENVMANVLLAVSGGISEPQHVATASVYYLERFPEARKALDADPDLWPSLFDESMRYLTPIAALSRHTTVDVVVGGYMIPADTPVGLLLAAANKDPEFVEDPEDFLLNRKGRTHIAFGTGPHQCAGRWAAKASIGEIAVPLLYRELPNFRVDNSRSSIWDEGFIFRGLSKLPVTWG